MMDAVTSVDAIWSSLKTKVQPKRSKIKASRSIESKRNASSSCALTKSTDEEAMTGIAHGCHHGREKSVLERDMVEEDQTESTVTYLSDLVIVSSVRCRDRDGRQRMWPNLRYSTKKGRSDAMQYVSPLSTAKTLMLCTIADATEDRIGRCGWQRYGTEG